MSRLTLDAVYFSFMQNALYYSSIILTAPLSERMQSARFEICTEQNVNFDILLATMKVSFDYTSAVCVAKLQAQKVAEEQQ